MNAAKSMVNAPNAASLLLMALPSIAAPIRRSNAKHVIGRLVTDRVEPSDDEQSQWPWATEAYVRALEARVQELEAFERRVRSAVDFMEPQDDGAMKAALAVDLAAGMSLRKAAAKHGTTVAIARGVARSMRMAS